jgi:hypothetical protein
VDTFVVLLYEVSISRLVWRRLASVRPRRAMLDAPDWAKAFAISEPMPEPPPVMTMFLPADERAGREGLIAAYALMWYVFVGDWTAMVIERVPE